MVATKGNGLEAANDQPAKTLTKYAIDFIARAASFATPDKAYMLLCVVVVVQLAAMALPDIFQSFDFAGLTMLAGGVVGKPAMFMGTDNSRHLRVIQALMTRPLPREQLDKVAGCSNGPELVAELRRRGLEIECTRTKKKDRDLFECWPGVYHFTPKARRRVIQWLAMRKAGSVNNA